MTHAHPRAARVAADGQRSRDLTKPLPAGLSWAVLAVFAVALSLAFVIAGIPLWIPTVYLGASVVSFAAYGLDKSAAKAGRRRVSEQSLLLLGLVGGWPGALVAQQVFRHKTRKRSFRQAFWFTVVVNVAVFAGLVYVAVTVTAPGMLEVPVPGVFGAG